MIVVNRANWKRYMGFLDLGTSEFFKMIPTAPPGRSFSNIHLSPNEDLLSFGDPYDLYLMDMIGTGQNIRKIYTETRNNMVTSLHWSPNSDSIYAIAYGDQRYNHTLVRINLENNAVENIFVSPSSTHVTAYDLNQNGDKIVLTIADGTLRIIDTEGNILKSLSSSEYEYIDPKWGPSNKYDY